jgi:hypothetical protein
MNLSGQNMQGTKIKRFIDEKNEQKFGQNPSRSIFSHCSALGFLSLPYLVVRGNVNPDASHLYIL